MATQTVKDTITSKRQRILDAKHRRVDQFAFVNQDRNKTFRFAQRLGLPADDIGEAMSRNFRLDGSYDGPLGEG